MTDQERGTKVSLEKCRQELDGSIDPHRFVPADERVQGKKARKQGDKKNRKGSKGV
jgi:hypothetical protein